MPDGSNAPVGTATESMTANGLLEVGETWSYNISYTVTQADIDNGTPLVNHVSVTTDETPDPVTDEETTLLVNCLHLLLPKRRSVEPTLLQQPAKL